MSCRRLAVTPGEPAGIGPDLVLQIAQQDWPHQLVVIADPALLRERAALLGLSIELEPYDATAPAHPQRAGTLTVCPITLGAPVVPGELNEGNGAYVLATLQRACDGNMSGEFAAVVTGPVHKGIINQAGVSFSGHTEFFAQQSGTADVVMMLATEGLRVALATTHIPLAYVAMAITEDRLGKVIRILNEDLATKFGIAKPRIYVCGLNPHAWEGGHLGREEIDVIEPALATLRQEGIDLVGPCRPTPCSRRNTSRMRMRYSPCTTTRGCLCSNTRALAVRSISPWGFPSSALRWITAPRWIWQARAWRIRAA